MSKIFNLNKSPKKGKLLLSEPFMQDPNFKRTVVLLCEVNKENGVIGFVLNRPLEVKITDIIPEILLSDFAVNYGGPVEQDTLHYLHNCGDKIPESIEIGEKIFWGGDFEIVKSLINSGEITKKNIRFFIGYSGWGEGQIEYELSEKSWFVTDCKSNDIFKTKQALLWSKILKELGGDYKTIANYPENPSLN